MQVTTQAYHNIQKSNVCFFAKVRLLNAFRFVLRSERPKFGPTPAQLFQPMITSSYAPLTEIDFNMHSELLRISIYSVQRKLITDSKESNSTYFSDLDIARTHLITTLFSAGIEQARNNKRNGMIGGGSGAFGIALGAVSCSFKKELKPYEKYEIWTRVLSWDEKWLYLVSHFVRKGKVCPNAYTLYPEQKSRNLGLNRMARKEDAIIASALSKCVFKKGRLTIPPVIMMEASGLLPSRPANVPLLRTDLYYNAPKKSLAAEAIDMPLRAFEKLDSVWDAAKRSFLPELDGAERESADELVKTNAETWTWEKIESERRRGLELAKLLRGLDGLDMEFTADSDALGTHSDMWWLLGVTR